MNDTIRGLPDDDFEVQRAPVMTTEWHREQGQRTLKDLIAMHDESIFDWHTWTGGEMPVPLGTLIDVQYRNGTGRAVRAGEFGARWWHAPTDIVRYRLREPAVRPRPLEDSENPERRVVEDRRHSHYFKDVSKLQTIDVYRVLALFNVSDPCLQHAVKKLLVAGGRGGGKDISRDIQEAIDTLTRWQGMRAEEVAS